MNEITIFSNGIASKSSSYDLEAGKKLKITLPVKKDHLGDVLASLNVFGDVDMVSFPTFPQESEGVLTLDSNNVFSDMGEKLSGVPVTLYFTDNRDPDSGTIIGTDIAVVNEKTTVGALVLLTAAGIRSYNLSGPGSIKTITIQDKEIKKEVERALNRNLQNIKPNSTVVEFELANKKELRATALVQYSVPAAAWKISYRLNLSDKNNEFSGLAIVDNNTEENWDNVIVSVVTGEPITFSTDVAQAKIPERQHVNIVKQKAISAVEVGTTACSFGGSHNANSRTYGGLNEDENVNFVSAFKSQVEASEEGDFCIFKSPNPTTIPAHSSSTIPVFNTQLSKAKTVLHYNQQNHLTRPYRSVDLKNETPHSLERGICTVNLNGIHAGSCIVPAMKQGESALLPYALETGVKVSVVQSYNDVKIKRIFTHNGSFVVEQAQRIDTEYTIKNVKDERFTFCLDHPCYVDENALVNARIEDDYLDGQYKDGIYKFNFDLNAKQEVVAEVRQINVEQTSLVINNNSYFNIYHDYIANNGPLTKVKEFADVVKACEEVSEIQLKIKNAQKEIKKLEEKSVRLRDNLASIENAKWQNDLIHCEDKIDSLNESLTELADKEQKAITKVINMLSKISEEILF
ncbi:MAG: DUF4139 domain-containing protein [Crenarchaeota archaeon]|nr:MAG: DUF4139 domain-containing protein [Thermoproteota archaeon]